MNRILIVFLALTVLIGGCSAANQSSAPTQVADSQAADQAATATPDAVQTDAPVAESASAPAAESTPAPEGNAAGGVQQGKGTIGKVDVEIVNAKADKTADGKDAVVVELKWKNNTGMAAAFKLSLNVDVTQNGANCEPAELDISSPINTPAGNQEIESGKEQTVWMVYTIADKSKINVVVSDRYGFGDGPTIAKTLDIQ